MPEEKTPTPEDLTPTPTQAELNEMVEAVSGRAIGQGQPVLVAREGEDLTPVMTQAQNDMAMLVAAGPPPDSLPPICKDVPYVSGAGTVGGTLTCTMGNWTGEPTGYAYAWSGQGTANGDSYVVGAADLGMSITCTVTATNDNGSTEAPPSNAVEIAAAAGTTSRPHERNLETGRFQAGSEH